MTSRQCRCGQPITTAKARQCDPCRALPPMRCSKCKKVKPTTKFSRDSTRTSGFFPWCMDCQRTSTSQFQNPDDEPNGHICPLCDTPCRGHANRRFCSVKCKDRVADLRNKYNLTPEQYRRLVAFNVYGKCPICKRHCTSWQVDHNHKTGAVTGAVCIQCNVGILAYSNHDVELLKSLVHYLECTPAQALDIDAVVPDGQNTPSNLHKKWNWGKRRAA